MDLGTQFIFLVIFGIAGFIIGKLTGFNPATFISDAGAVIFALPLIIITLKVSADHLYGLTAVGEIINWYAGNLSGIIIGTLAGNVVGVVTGGK